jgi:hypothetical protein
MAAAMQSYIKARVKLGKVAKNVFYDIWNIYGNNEVNAVCFKFQRRGTTTVNVISMIPTMNMNCLQVSL